MKFNFLDAPTYTYTYIYIYILYGLMFENKVIKMWYIMCLSLCDTY